MTLNFLNFISLNVSINFNRLLFRDCFHRATNWFCEESFAKRWAIGFGRKFAILQQLAEQNGAVLYGVVLLHHCLVMIMVPRQLMAKLCQLLDAQKGTKTQISVKKAKKKNKF